jgi:hypothetical protein
VEPIVLLKPENQVWSREISESRSPPVNLWLVMPLSVELISPNGK